MNITPTAFELASGIDFPQQFQEIFSASNWNVVATGNMVFVWSANNEWQHEKWGRIANGLRIMRLASTASNKRYCIMPRVQSVDSKTISLDAEASRQISETGNRMPTFSCIRRLFLIKDLLRDLQRVFRNDFTSIDNLVTSTSVSEENVILLGGGCAIQHPQRLWMPLKNNGLLQGPPPSRILVYSEQFPQDKLNHIARRLRQSISSLTSNTIVETCTFQEAIEQCASFPSGPLRTVAYIGVLGEHGSPLPEGTLKHLASLNKLNIPFRVFGSNTHTQPYALNDQVVHLIELLGGQAFRIQPVSGFENTRFIGFDLGHPTKRSFSVPVMTVVDSYGALVGFWKGRQKKDETLLKKSIAEACQWFRRFSENFDSDTEWLVLRDGKSFSNDGVDLLLKQLEPAVTYVEVIKNPVPLLVAEGKSAPPGSMVVAQQGEEAILQTESPWVVYQMGLPIRLRIKQNSQNRSLESICAAVYSLCHAPALGLRTTRIPSPVYWANGIAKNAGNSIQFAGLNHVPHNANC